MILFIFVMILTSRDCLCFDASSEVPEDVLNEEGKYYLPQQTVFGRPGSVIASKTSPPSIMIEPSTTLKMKEEFSKEMSGSVTKASFCTSEARSKVVSELLPSKDISQESVVLSGYMETPSKTSDDHHVPEMSRLVTDDKIFIGSAF